MIIWLTPDNAIAFESVWRQDVIDKAHMDLQLSPKDLREFSYLLAYYQINGIKFAPNTEECVDALSAGTSLLHFKMHRDDTEARQKVFTYILTCLDGRGIVLDLNSLLDTKHTADVLTKEAHPQTRNGELALPNGVITIDVETYMGDTSLKHIKCCEGLSAIHARAFQNTANLKSVEFNKKLTYIGQQAFYGAGLMSIEFPASMRVIEEESFACERELISIQFNDGLLSIGRQAFMQDIALEEVNIPITCRTLYDGAFSMCNSVRRYNLPCVETIGSYCFYENRSLVDIVLPQSLNTLGSRVFEGCTELKYLHLPASIPNIADDAFVGLPKECKIIVHSDAKGDTPISVYLYLHKIKYEVV